jgi:uncharacterized protein (DUF2384 family)
MNHPCRRRAPQGPVLSADEGKRQSRAVHAAQAALGSVNDVRAFLNSHDESLGGRPIDIAIASDAGLAAVEAALAAADRRHASGGEAESRAPVAGNDQ